MGVLFAIFLSIEVVGTTECPAPSDVSVRLPELIATSMTAVADRVVLEKKGDELLIELQRNDVGAVARRILNPRGTCADKADAVAAMVAAWESDLQTGAPTPAGLPAHIDVGSNVTSSHSLAWDFDAGFLASVGSGGFAAGGIVDVAVSFAASDVVVRAGLAGTDTRDLSVGMGRASWNRFASFVGTGLRERWNSWSIDPHLEFVGGWLFVQGRGYTLSHSDDAFDPGVGGGVRVGRAHSPLSAWADVSAVGWLRHQTVSVAEAGGSTLSANVPRFDVWLSLGISFGSSAN